MLILSAARPMIAPDAASASPCLEDGDCERYVRAVWQVRTLD